MVLCFIINPKNQKSFKFVFIWTISFRGEIEETSTIKGIKNLSSSAKFFRGFQVILSKFYSLGKLNNYFFVKSMKRIYCFFVLFTFFFIFF